MPLPPASAQPRLRVPLAALVLAAAIAAITILAYRAAPGHPFLNWDDEDYVTHNALVLARNWGALLRAVVSGNYHPLTMLSLALNVSTPLSPLPFIATNVALHGLNAALVFWLAWRLSGGVWWVASLTALWFGVHPIHVESVAWVSERKDVLYGTFFLAAAIAYWRHLERPGRGSLALVFVLFALSCLAKAMAISFPAIMILLDLWRRRPLFERRALLEKLPFVILALLVGLVAVDAQAGGDLHGLLTTARRGSALAVALPYTPLERAALPTFGYALYLLDFVAPVSLSAFYPYPPPGEAGALKCVASLLFLAATLAVAVRDGRHTRIITLGIGWYIATLVLVLQWVPVGAALRADRYTYLPSVGMFFAAAMGIRRALERSRPTGLALLSAGACLAGVFFIQTGRQVEVWRDSEALWTNVIRKYPELDVGYVRRANARLDAGSLSGAMDDFHTAQSLGSWRPELFEGLGNAYVRMGERDSALAMFDRALARCAHEDPRCAGTFRNRALAYLQFGQPREALADLDRALALAPGDSGAVAGPRGYAFKQLGRLPEAIAELDRAIRLNPPEPVALYQRGVCLLAVGDRAGAEESFRAVLRLNPRHAAARAALRRLPPRGMDR